jgi:NAD(P)-dependent dehydrogenase (short-subunit alcohol dehydrogenase family)
MAGRSALVSGADPALLAALADRLSADGFTITPEPGSAITPEPGSAITPEPGSAITPEPGERLDVLVHVVGVPAAAPFLGADPTSWYAEVMAGLTPAFRAVRAAAPALRRSPVARVVLVGAGWFPADRPESTVAAALHGALVALTKTLARDLGPDGITVNQVVVDPADPGDPATVAAAVSYLCRPEAGAVAGQLLTVGRGGPVRP